MISKEKTPPHDVLHRVLFVLHRGLADVRYLARDGKSEQAYELADTLENIPGLLVNWKGHHLTQIKKQLQAYQTKYRQISSCDYAKYLEDEAPPRNF